MVLPQATRCVVNHGGLVGVAEGTLCEAGVVVGMLADAQARACAVPASVQDSRIGSRAPTCPVLFLGLHSFQVRALKSTS